MMSKHRQRGYTAVELVMALAILGIGVSGVIAMQKITIVSNQHAKNMAIALRIAEGWAEALTIDGSMWNWADANPDLGDTAWLNLVNNAQWFRPPFSVDMDRGAEFNAVGAPLPDGAGINAVFCTHLRLFYVDRGLEAENAEQGSGLIRAEIRVAWRREIINGNAPPDFCTTVDAPQLANADTANDYHFVHLTTAIAQQSGVTE